MEKTKTKEGTPPSPMSKEGTPPSPKGKEGTPPSPKTKEGTPPSPKTLTVGLVEAKPEKKLGSPVVSPTKDDKLAPNKSRRTIRVDEARLNVRSKRKTAKLAPVEEAQDDVKEDNKILKFKSFRQSMKMQRASKHLEDDNNKAKPQEKIDTAKSTAATDATYIDRFRLMVNKVMLLLARGYKFPPDGTPMEIDPVVWGAPHHAEDVPDDFHFEEKAGVEHPPPTEEEQKQTEFQTDEPSVDEGEEQDEEEEEEEEEKIPEEKEIPGDSAQPSAKKPAAKRHPSQEDVKINGITLAPYVFKRLMDYGKRPKVAFLSSVEREYYPEHPGHSKFAQVYKSQEADPDLPSPQYYMDPFADKLTKPISNLGYGIGGLSGPRFPPDEHAEIPAPNVYQKHYNEILKQNRFPPAVWKRYGLLRREDKPVTDEKLNRKLHNLWGKCHQTSVAFGSCMKQPRFGKKSQLNTTVGPGHYTIRQLKKTPPLILPSFMRGPTITNPTTKLHCTWGPKDHCIECHTQLTGERDYYRSKTRINARPLRAQFDALDDRAVLMTAAEKNKMEADKRRFKRVLLCRHCYCRAQRGESLYFKDRVELERIFEKTRYCGYIHDHNGIPEFTMKASCYWTRKLTRKEAVLSKYYGDACEKRPVERGKNHRPKTPKLGLAK